jgi:hypothetical protein
MRKIKLSKPLWKKKIQDSTENETNEVPELEQTFFDSSHYDKNNLKTTSDVNLRKHTEKPHVTNFQCDFCDFPAKNLSVLKTHIRRMHSLPQNMHECEHCTFTSKTENELKKRNKTFNTHYNLDYNEHLEELNYEIFAFKEI